MLYDKSNKFIARVIDSFVITQAMDKLGARIKSRREKLELDQVTLARRVGVSQPTLANIEAGKNKRTKYLAEFARELGTTAEWLSTGAGTEDAMGIHPTSQPQGTYIVPSHRYRQVPVIGKGMGGIPDSRTWTDGDFPPGESNEYADIATTDLNAFLAKVEEGSMAPRYNPGEYALVEPGTEPEIEDDVLVRFADDGTALKRLLSRRDGYIRLGSYANHETVTCKEEDIVWMYYVAHPVPRRKIKSRT